MYRGVDSYRDVHALSDGPDRLCLAWTLDERDCLGLNMDEFLRRELEAELDGGLAQLYTYLVTDPFGSAAIGETTRQFFGLSARVEVSAAAGVGALIGAIAELARVEDRKVISLGPTYPDFIFHAERLDLDHHIMPPQTRFPERPEAIRSLMYLERPSILGQLPNGLTELAYLAEDLREADSLLVVDESNANYCPASYSAASLVEDHPNLVVMRGFSKAFGLGSLRVGLLLASPDLSSRLRLVLPPLQCSSMSLSIAGALMRQGDITQPLRERIHENKERMTAALSELGIGYITAHSALPYVFFAPEERAIARFESVGIFGKWHSSWGSRGEGLDRLYRLSVPLLPQRVLRLRALLAAI